MEKVKAMQAAVSAALIERDAEVRAITLALVAREHVLLVGPPGCAKSLLASSVARAIAGARSFSLLLTKYTTPEEVFGPVSLAALKADRYERKLAGFLADCELAFLDEIWKASSAILNNLLTGLQERAFDNGGARVAMPLRTCIAASNEWPNSEEAQELGAVFDRFTIRRKVSPVSPQGRDALLYAALPPVSPVATLADIDAAAIAAESLPVSGAARSTFAQIFDELGAAGIRPGDRRSRKAVAVARAAASIEGAAEVLPHHLEDLGMVLWVDPEQADKAADIITRVANPVGARVNELLREADAIAASAVDAASRVAAVAKLGELSKEAQKLALVGNGRATAAAKFIRREHGRINAVACGIPPHKIEEFLALQGAA